MQQLLHRGQAREGHGFLIGLYAGLENTDDSKAAIDHFVIGALGHDDNAFAETCVEILGHFSAQDDAVIVRAGEKTAVDDVVGNKRQAGFGLRVDAVQRHTACITFAGDHRRYPDAARPHDDIGFFQAGNQLFARCGHQVLDARIVAKSRMMNLHMAGQGANTVTNHVIDHAAYQRRHENHRPDADHDGREHDQRAAWIAPQIAPCECHDDPGNQHHAALIAVTGRSQCRRRAG